MARDHLQFFVNAADGRAAADSARARAYPEGVPVEDVPLAGRVRDAFWWGDQGERDEAMEALRRAPPLEVYRAAAMIGLEPESWREARLVNRLLTRSERPDTWRAFGHIHEAILLTARGRWREAEEAFEAATRLAPTVAQAHRAFLASLPFVEAPEGALVSLLERISAADPTPEEWCPMAIACLVVDGGEPLLPPYLAGHLSAKLGDTEEALRRADKLEAVAVPEALIPLARNLARGLRARVALEHGAPAEAVALLAGEPMIWSQGMPEFGLIYGLALERYLRAEALRELGRAEEALRWYRGLGEINPLEVVFLVPSRLNASDIRRQEERPEEGRAYEEAVG